MLTSVERFNNSQQLYIMGLIPSLSKNQFSGEKGYRMLSAQIIQDQLIENSTNSIARSIRFNSNIMFQIKMI